MPTPTPRRARPRFVLALISFGMLIASAATALADKLILIDGTVIEGKVMGRDSKAITFGADEDGQLVVRRYPLSRVKQVIPEIEGQKERPPESANPTKRPVRKVVFLLDVSGSMALGQRFDKARAALLAQVKTFRPRVRVQFYSFSSQVVALQRDYRNCIEGNIPGFENVFKRLTLDPRSGTDIGRALRDALNTRPDALYLYTDGIQRGRTGQKIADLVKLAARVNSKKIAIHVRLIQDGRLPYLAGEPLDAARQALKQVAEASGGSYEASGGEVKARGAELGAELAFLDLKGNPAETLTIGGRYRLVVALKNFNKPEDAVLEYLSELPVLARSVDAAGKDVVRRKEIALIVRKGVLESLDTVKIVGPGDTYRDTSGYLAASVGGKVAVFFDAMNGRLVTLERAVASAPSRKAEESEDGESR